MARVKQGDYGGRPCFLEEASSTMSVTWRQPGRCYEGFCVLQKCRFASQMDCESYIIEWRSASQMDCERNIVEVVSSEICGIFCPLFFMLFYDIEE